MRDRMMLLILGIIAAVGFGLGVLFPEPHVEIASITFMIFLVLAFIPPMNWMKELLRRMSPQLVGPGFFTSLLQLEPVDSCRTYDAKEKVWYEWLLFLHGGIKLFGYSGGGVQGCSVVRKDLIMAMKGNMSSLVIYSVPKPFQMDAKPGDASHDATGLPLDIYKMVQRHNFHPSGHIMLWENPIDDPRSQIKDMEMMNSDNLLEQANSQILRLSETVKNLTDKLTKISETKDTVDRSFGRKSGWRERERPENRDADGGESRWQ